MSTTPLDSDRPGRRVALISGRFRQIHPGHLAVVRIALEGLGADRVMIFPDLFAETSGAKGELPPLDARVRAIVVALRKQPGVGPADADLLRLYHVAGMPSVAARLREGDEWDPIRVVGGDVALRALASGRMAFEIGGGLPWAVVGRPGFDIADGRLPPGVVLLPSSGFDMPSAQVFGTE